MPDQEDDERIAAKVGFILIAAAILHGASNGEDYLTRSTSESVTEAIKLYEETLDQLAVFEAKKKGEKTDENRSFGKN